MGRALPNIYTIQTCLRLNPDRPWTPEFRCARRRVWMHSAFVLKEHNLMANAKIYCSYLNTGAARSYNSCRVGDCFELHRHQTGSCVYNMPRDVRGHDLHSLWSSN